MNGSRYQTCLHASSAASRCSIGQLLTPVALRGALSLDGIRYWHFSGSAADAVSGFAWGDDVYLSDRVLADSKTEATRVVASLNPFVEK